MMFPHSFSEQVRKMTKQPRDEFDSLRHQDPAQGVEFDLESLRANVASRIPQGSFGAAPRAEETEPTDLPTNVVPMTRKPKHRVAWLQVAASVAVTALVTASVVSGANGSGPLAALAGGSGSDTSQADQEMRSTDPEAGDVLAGAPERGVEGPQQYGTAEASPGQAPRTEGGTSLGTDGMGDYVTMPNTGRNVYVGKGLPTISGTATAYGFDESGVVNKKTFSTLKKVFGVTGETTTEWGSYSLSSGNAYLSLSGGGTGAFWFSSYTEQPSGKPLSEAKAIDQAKALMEELGVDSENYTFTYNHDFEVALDATEPAAGASADTDSAAMPANEFYSRVTASLKDFDTEANMAAWSFEFNSKTATMVSGSLGSIVDLGSYPIISASEGVERLNDGRFGPSAYPTNFVALPYSSGRAEIKPDDGPTPVPPATPGGAFPWTVTIHTMTNPTLKNAGFYLNGVATVLPVWEYTSSNGGTYQVLAVAESALKF